MFQLQNLQTDSILEGAWHEKNTCLMRNLLDTSSHLSHLKAMAKLSRQVATWAGDSSEGVYIPEIWRMDSPIWRIGWRYLYICQISNGCFIFEPTQLKSYAISSHFLDVEVGCQKSFWGQTNIKEAYFP